MKRLMAAAVAALVVAAGGSPAKDDAPEKSIDGTYKVLSATFGGKTDTEKTKDATFEFKDGTVTIRDAGGKKEEAAQFKLDPTKKPAHIDITPKNDKVVLGIYQTKATKDGLELTVAFTKDGGDRPTDFKGNDPGTVVIKLLRPGAKK
jgi:uncharacterized protein (TIGR03067 family)